MAAIAALILLFAQSQYAFPPASRDLSIVTDVAYGSSGGAPLAMDVYKPSAGFHGPALIFFNRAVGADRRQPFWDAWARAAGFVQSRKFHEAAAAYASLVAAHPDDTRLRLSYGEALLGDARYANACAELEKLKGKGLGPRDLGLPAAEACVKSGDPDRAIEWLRTIPPQFRPATLQNDPAFAALRSRPDFRALFTPRN
jgi:hypothetical protein